jgi:hypothetical protein
VIGGGYIKFAGFAVVHQKITGLLGGATKPRPKTGRGCLSKTGLTGLENRSDLFWVAGHRKIRSGGHMSGSQGLRRGYAKCGRWASVQWRKSSDGEILKTSKTALEGLVSLVIK